jgi:hypothetical protein
MFEQFTTCFGALIISFRLAFIAAITVEASFLNLEKIVVAFKLKGHLVFTKVPASVVKSNLLV